MTDDPVEAHLGDDQLAIRFKDKGDLHAACLIRALKARGIPEEAFSVVHGVVRTRQGDWMRVALPDKVAYYRIGCLWVGPPGSPIEECRHINGTLLSVIDNKQVTKDLLAVLGFPTPVGRMFSAEEEEEAMAYCRAFSGPVCIKGLWRGQGNLVFPALTEEEDMRRAFRMAAEEGRQLLVEAHWPGAAVRFHFIRPKVVGVRRDIPGNVVGDGRSTVAELIAAKNREKRRRTGHQPIAINDDARRRLAAEGLTLEDVPEAGRVLFLRAVSNGYKGGDSISCRDAVHPSYVEEIERLCNSLAGFRVTAVDTKILDISAPARPDNYVILEANSNPGMVPFMFPWEGERQDVAGALADALLDPQWYGSEQGGP